MSYSNPTRSGAVRLASSMAFLSSAAAFILLLVNHDRRALPVAAIATSIGCVAYSRRHRRDEWDRATHPYPLAPLIAIVGCDGSGKSTLSADMQIELSAGRPVACCYLGLGSGELGNRIKELPLVGVPFERILARKASRTRTKGEKIPGLATALVVYGFSVLRLRRFRRVLDLRRQGVAVITDRYPQIEVLGFYDGPGLSAASAGSRIVAWLAARERRMYDWMSSFRPDLVLRLNVDTDTALLRKPDHKPELLRAKVNATSLLRFRGAKVVDIDACAPYDGVREQALSWTRMALNGADLGPSIRLLRSRRDVSAMTEIAVS